MKTMLKSFYARPLAVYLALALLAITTFAGPAEAMLVTSAHHQEAAVPTAVSFDRAADLARVQAALESKIVQQTLVDYGLTPEEAIARVSTLSDEQLNLFAANTDALQAGGDGGMVVGLMVVVCLVVLLIYLLQGRIEIH